MAVTIARTAWIDDDGSGTTGTVLNNAIKTELYNQIDGALAGLPPGSGFWTDVSFNAANFTVPSGSWTVPSQSVYAYLQLGKALWVTVQVTSSTLTGTPGNLSVALPPGFSIVRNTISNAFLGIAGAYENGISQAAAGSAINIFRTNLQPFAAGTVRVDFTILVVVA